MSLTQSERDEALALLRDSESEWFRLLDGVSDRQWTFKPSPERWSIGETAEHVAIIEPLILKRILGALNSPENDQWEAKTLGLAHLRPGLLNRSGKIDAPEMLHPKSELTHYQIIARFRKERAKTLAFVETTQAPLKRHFAPHPVLGDLSGYSWLLALALHTTRHNLQIAEVQNDPGYPTGDQGSDKTGDKASNDAIGNKASLAGVEEIRAAK